MLTLPFGVSVATGVVGFVLLLVLTALWSVVFSGFLQVIAPQDPERRRHPVRVARVLPTPLSDAQLRPSQPAHPADGWRPTFNPLTYIMEAMRSLNLEESNWAAVGAGFAVVAVAGIARSP